MEETVERVGDSRPVGGRLTDNQAVLSRLAMSFVAMSWGMAYVAVKFLLLHGWTQTQVALIRIVIPGLTLAPLAYVSIRRRWGQPQIRLLPRMALLGLFGFGLSHFATVWGQQGTTAAVTGLLSVASPLTALILAAALKIDRFSYRKVAGAALSIVGVAVVVLYGRGPSELSFKNLSGPLLIILGFALVGVYNNAIRALHRDFAPLEVSALTAVWPALVGLWPAYRILGSAPWGALPTGGVLAVLWLSLAAGALAYFCASYAVSKIGPSSAASFLYLNPVVSILGGWLFLGETITLWLLIGAAFILTGLFLANRKA
ncbi:MAG TPA: DMT family transporter [Anaerolineales bacterium]